MLKKYIYYIFLFCGLWLSLNLPLFAQTEVGKPFVHNYLRRDYNASSQNWAIVQDKRGLLYVGNDDGLMEFDGIHWRLIELPNHSAVRSLAINKQGRIYVGGSSEIGYLAPDSLGKITYISLLTQLPEKYRNFADVWTTHITSQGQVLFQTDNYLFWFNEQHQAQVTPAPAQTSFFLSFLLQDQLYLHVLGKGLCSWQNEQLQLVDGGELFAQKMIYTLLLYDQKTLLAGVKNEGLFWQKTEDNTFELWQTPANDFLNKNTLYTGLKLYNGNFIFGTRKAGAIIINKRGDIIEIIDQQSNLQDNNIRYFFQSNEHTLWLALDEGISRVEIHSPIRFWDKHNGLKGRVESMLRFQGILYVATSSGLFYLKNNAFYPIPDTDTQCWYLTTMTIGDTQKLLLANNKGVFEINNFKAIPISQDNSIALCLFPSKQDKNRLWIGLKSGLMSLRWHNNQWHNEGKLQSIENHEEVYSLLEDAQGNIWLGTFIHGVVKISLQHKPNLIVQKVERFDKRHGFRSVRDLRIFQVQNRLLFGTKSGLYYWSEKHKQFKPDTILAQAFVDKSVFSLIEDSRQQLWIAGVDNVSSQIGKISRQNAQSPYQFNNTILKRLPEIHRPYFWAEDDALWIGAAEGLFKFNVLQHKNYYQNFQTLIREVRIDNENTIFQGAFSQTNQHKKQLTKELNNQQKDVPIIPFEDNSITFYYAAPQFEGENDQQLYSYILEGYDEKWSEWTSDTKRQYTNLYEGTYTFRVKAKNIYAFESQEALYTFKISPPPYRTWWAYLLYAMLTILILAGVGYMNNQRLMQRNERLELAIQKRTQEITQKNIVLETQSAEISLQAETLATAYHEINKQKAALQQIADEVKASINYASRIQNAILPDLPTIKQGIPEVFILYRPRDIVSGDFYWYTETQAEPQYAIDPQIKASVFKGFSDVKQIIAAIDCTGHGVPGAFMSMIGDSYLNQIVNVQGITEPEIILRELHYYVSTALRKQKTQNNDGMDMAICVIDQTNKVLEYAGARNPLIYIQDNAIHKIAGDRYAVGGYIFDDMFSRQYTRHAVHFDKPTWFYIFSDGYQDQFGRGTLRKFTTKQLYNLFLDIHTHPAEVQKQILEDTLDTWIYESTQVDDILIIGFQLQ